MSNLFLFYSAVTFIAITQYIALSWTGNKRIVETGNLATQRGGQRERDKVWSFLSLLQNWASRCLWESKCPSRCICLEIRWCWNTLSGGGDTQQADRGRKKKGEGKIDIAVERKPEGLQSTRFLFEYLNIIWISNNSNFLCLSLLQDSITQSASVKVGVTAVNLGFTLLSPSDNQFQTPAMPIFPSHPFFLAFCLLVLFPTQNQFQSVDIAEFPVIRAVHMCA